MENTTDVGLITTNATTVTREHRQTQVDENRENRTKITLQVIL